MPISSKIRAALVLALVAATLTSVGQPAGAAPQGGTAPVTVDWDGTQARQGKAPTGQPLVLPGRTRAGINTAITCYVVGLGPSLLGRDVSFSISVNCVGGTPRYLEVRQNIARHIAPGNYVIEPGSYAACPGSYTTILLCSSIAACYQAGANYDGYAVLMGVDEFGETHWATYYQPPVWVGCIV